MLKQALLLLCVNIAAADTSAHYRLLRFICNATTSQNPWYVEWKTSERPTPLKEICHFRVTVTGLPSKEAGPTDKNLTESETDVKHSIQTILSIGKPSNLKLGPGSIRLSPVTFDSNSSESGEIDININEILLPSVAFCGHVYIYVILQKHVGINLISGGMLYISLNILCTNESDVDLVAQIELLNGDTGIKLNHRSNESLTLSKTIKVMVKNQGNATFRSRCGFFSLQVLLFFQPLQYESTSAKSINDPFGYSTGRHRVHIGNRLVTGGNKLCSPAIAANAAETLHLQFSFAEKILGPGTLVAVVDPLNLVTEKSKGNNVAEMKITAEAMNYIPTCNLLADCTLDGTSALVPFTTKNESSYFYYNNDGLGINMVNNFTYGNLEATRIFYSEWLQEIAKDLLMLANECSDPVRRPPLIEVFLEFVENFIVVAATTKGLDEWQNDEIYKLVTLLKSVRYFLKESLHGELTFYLPELAELLAKTIFTETKKSEPFFLCLPEVAADIYKHEPPKSEKAALVPRRLRLFFRRLMLEGVDAVAAVVPNLKKRKRLHKVEKIRESLLMIASNNIANFSLPDAIQNQLKAVAMTRGEEFQKGIKDLQNNIASYVNGDKRNNSKLALFNLLLKRTSDAGLWQIWDEFQTGIATVSKESKTKRLYSIGWPTSKAPSNSFCQDAALKLIEKWSFYLPQWLKKPLLMTNLKEDSKQATFFEVKENRILKGELDTFLGKVFWEPIFFCYLEDSQVENCSFSHSGPEKSRKENVLE